MVRWVSENGLVTSFVVIGSKDESIECGGRDDKLGMGIVKILLCIASVDF